MNKNLNVVILMSTYNGERFLSQQLESIKNQSYKNWSLIVSDDGSNDKTLEILKKFQSSNQNLIKILNGPCKGFNFNFMSLINNDEIKGDLYAFSDQDDIWEKEKLANSVNHFIGFKDIRAFLYCGRTKYIDENNNFFNYSPLFKKKPTFNNAIIQSLAGGNTMVFNNKTRELLKGIGKNKKVVSHDWATYQVVSGSNGYIYYDSWPSVLYRQHRENLVGSNISVWSAFKRLILLFNGTFKEWNSINLSYLQTIKHSLSNEAQLSIDELIEIRNLSFLNRLYRLKNLKFYRQTFAGNIALKIAFIINRI